MSNYVLEGFKILKTEKGNLVFYKTDRNKVPVIYLFKNSKEYNSIEDIMQPITIFYNNFVLDSYTLADKTFDIEVNEGFYEDVCRFRVKDYKRLDNPIFELKYINTRQSVSFANITYLGDSNPRVDKITLDGIKIYYKSDYNDDRTGWYIAGISSWTTVIELRILEEQAKILIDKMRTILENRFDISFTSYDDFNYITDIRVHEKDVN